MTPAPKSSPAGSRAAGGSRASAKRRRRPPKTDGGGGAVGDGLASLAEQVTNRVLKPLGLVVLTTERIQEVLDDAAERG
jgi:hypothetical protein